MNVRTNRKDFGTLEGILRVLGSDQRVLGSDQVNHSILRMNS
jgi:hypothetical protein